MKANAALNVAGTVIPLLAAIVTVPLYLDSVGAARFGVLSLVWLFTGYFSLLDFGISRATVNMIARVDAADVLAQRRILWSALWISGTMGFLGLCIAYALAHTVFGRVQFDEPALRDELARAIPWLCLTVPLLLIHGVLQGGLEARERFGVVNVLNVVGGLISQVLPVVVAYQISPHLDVLIPAIVLARVLMCGVVVWVTQRTFPLGRPLRWDATSVRQLVSFGSWASVSGIISPLLEALDRFVIGAKLGASDVALYAIPFSIADKLRILPRALARAAYPRLSSLPAQEARQLYRQLMTTSLKLMTPLVLMAIVACKHLMLLWIDSPLDGVGGVVAIVLLCGAWFNSMALVPFAYVQARGRPNVTATIHAVEFIPFVLVLLALVSAYGVVGAAIAWAGRMLVDCALLCLASREIGPDIMVPLALHGSVLTLCAYVAAHHVLTWPQLLGAMVVLTGVAIAMNLNLVRRMLPGSRHQKTV